MSGNIPPKERRGAPGTGKKNMTLSRLITVVLLMLGSISIAVVTAHVAPSPSSTIPTQPPSSSTGRIAISSDGNDHDCDDLTATPMGLALLAKSGNAARLVYYGHSDHIWSTGTDGACNGGNREEEMRISSEETARLWGGFDLSVFINAKAQTTAAVAALTAQINASSAADPLWIIGAGPMEVIGLSLSASETDKRQYVTVVSHSEWNDEHAEQPGHGTWHFSELGSVLGANLKRISDQNDGLRVHESNYLWLQQSSDPSLNWLWQRHLKTGLSPDFDPSDAGMIYWLITGGNNGGDQNATPAKLRAVLEGGAPPPPAPTPTPIPSPSPTPTPALASILVTAPGGAPLHSVTHGTTINLADLVTRSLSINVVPSTPVGSVRLQFNGQVRVENVPPYSLAGDTNGSFNPADLSVGNHTLTVTPYSQPNLDGTPGATTSISFAVVDNPQGLPPRILTEENSDRAIAFNAATFIPQPFTLFTEDNFSWDKRTRVKFFVTNVAADSSTSDTVVHAENPQLGILSLPIEHIGGVPNFDWLTQVTVRLPDQLAEAGDAWIRVVSQGESSNQARITIAPPAVGRIARPPGMTLFADSWIASNRLLQWPTAPRPLRANQARSVQVGIR